MAEKLKVVALISGGKDSIFSILHCMAHGHEIVALANLYPEGPSTNMYPPPQRDQHDEGQIDDVESHMYQTIGHSIIPLYSEALRLPLYRQPIHGKATNKAKFYRPTDPSDETESLIPLLKLVMSHHPDANAISSGAILSTYQRTRIESIALRLGLTPLAYLWQYPLLAPYLQSSLLRDMRDIGLDARIIKTASGGLGPDILWQNVAEDHTIRALECGVARFKNVEKFPGPGRADGAVLGEGGEFETLAIDGPEALFRGRIIVDDADVQLIGEAGGSAFARLLKGRVGQKGTVAAHSQEGLVGSMKGLQNLRKPPLWDDEFLDLLHALEKRDEFKHGGPPSPMEEDIIYPWSTIPSQSNDRDTNQLRMSTVRSTSGRILYISNITAPRPPAPMGLKSGKDLAEEETNAIVSKIQKVLSAHNLSPSNIIFTTILLRSMFSFTPVNKVYSRLFTEPNPPARVTVALGDRMPGSISIMISLIVEAYRTEPNREALHVQSRSYWAPSNIGPYSQSVITPLLGSQEASIVHVAGQIPLVPSTMESLETDDFVEHAALSLQHLWRIGRETGVRWWAGGAVAYVVNAYGKLSVRSRAKVIGEMWRRMHVAPLEADWSSGEGENEDVDVGDAALYRPWGYRGVLGSAAGTNEKTYRAPLPDWDCLLPELKTNTDVTPSCVVAEVAELPKGACVEWSSFGLAGTDLALNISMDQHGEVCRAGGHQVTWNEFTTEKELSAFNERYSGQIEWNYGLKELYASPQTPGPLIESLGGMLIPCTSLWNLKGEKLIAALRWST